MPETTWGLNEFGFGGEVHLAAAHRDAGEDAVEAVETVAKKTVEWEHAQADGIDEPEEHRFQLAPVGHRIYPQCSRAGISFNRPERCGARRAKQETGLESGDRYTRVGMAIASY